MKMKTKSFNEGLTFIAETAIEMIGQDRNKDPVKGSLLIAISGGTCSGKSFLSGKLSELLIRHGKSVSIIPLDNYFRGRDNPKLPRNNAGRPIFDMPDSYRKERYICDVFSLMSGEAIKMPQYDIKTNTIVSDEGKLAKPGNIIIAEGLFAIRFLKKILPEEKVLTVFVQLSEEEQLERRIERDVSKFGISAEKIKKYFEEKILPCQKEHVEPQMRAARIIILGKGG
jgi:uridine kinase